MPYGKIVSKRIEISSPVLLTQNLWSNLEGVSEWAVLHRSAKSDDSGTALGNWGAVMMKGRGSDPHDCDWCEQIQNWLLPQVFLQHYNATPKAVHHNNSLVNTNTTKITTTTTNLLYINVVPSLTSLTLPTDHKHSAIFNSTSNHGNNRNELTQRLLEGNCGIGFSPWIINSRHAPTVLLFDEAKPVWEGSEEIGFWRVSSGSRPNGRQIRDVHMHLILLGSSGSWQHSKRHLSNKGSVNITWCLMWLFASSIHQIDIHTYTYSVDQLVSKLKHRKLETSGYIGDQTVPFLRLVTFAGSQGPYG